MTIDRLGTITELRERCPLWVRNRHPDKELKLELQQQSCARAGKVRQIKCGADADLASGNLRLPSRVHKDFGGNPPVECRSEIDGVAGEGIEHRSVIMAQVPELGTDCDIGNDLEGERGRHAKGRFLLPHTEIGAGGLRLVEEIKAEVEAVFDEFGIGFEPCLKAVVHDLVAARLVATVEFRLQRQTSRPTATAYGRSGRILYRLRIH